MAEHSSLKLSQKLIVIAADIVVLAAVCFGMYRASLNPDELTRAFLTGFLPLALPAVVAAVVGIRLLRDRKEPQNQAQAQP